MAELERINSLAEGLRAEAHRQQTQLVLLQDQMAQCSRSIELIRERMEALNRRLSEEPSFHSKRQKSLLVSIPSENGIVKAVIVALLAMIFALATGQIAPLLGLIR